jgi:phosphoribosylamine-glycine ligase
MRVLIIEVEGEATGLALAMRAQEWGHSVRYWLPPSREELTFGDGMLTRPEGWESLMDGSDLIIINGNTRYAAKFEPYFTQGYPVFGANARSANLELDRAAGQKALESAGVQVLPYTTVDDLNSAIDYVTANREPVVIKPWGGEGDKSLTCVANSPEEAIFQLERWRDQGLQSKLMLQKKAEGVEMGIAGWFSPEAGWLRMKEESWEHKRFMNDDLGANTGEQGTVIRHVQDSLLFDRVLRPMTDYLYSIGYVGDCSVNCIIDSDGAPWPLEFTARLGWPDFNIRLELMDHDPVSWMKAMLSGRDEFNPRQEVGVGIVLTHGDYPVSKDPHEKWSGFPLSWPVDEEGTDYLWQHIQWQMVRMGQEPYFDEDGNLRRRRAVVTAGAYVAVVTASAETVEDASVLARNRADVLKWPSNSMYRTDIGRKLAGELQILQSMGYARGLKYSNGTA